MEIVIPLAVLFSIALGFCIGYAHSCRTMSKNVAIGGADKAIAKLKDAGW